MAYSTFTNAPQSYARAAGILGLFIVTAGIFAEGFVRGRLIISGDPSVTAQNILASETLFRSAIAGELIMLCCDIGLAVIYYVLLRPVDRNLALLAAFFRLALAAISGINALNLLSAMLMLGGTDYMSVFPPEQINALVMLLLKTHTYGYHISLVFFAFHLLVAGFLIFKSTYFPRILGIMLIIASACYLTNSLTAIIAPNMFSGLFPIILLPPFIAEMSLTLWLLIKGVDREKWDYKSGGKEMPVSNILG